MQWIVSIDLNSLVACSLSLGTLIFVNWVLHLILFAEGLSRDVFVWRCFESVSARSWGVLLIRDHLLIKLWLSGGLEFQAQLQLWPEAQYPNLRAPEELFPVCFLVLALSPNTALDLGMGGDLWRPSVPQKWLLCSLRCLLMDVKTVLGFLLIWCKVMLVWISSGH